ncbi:hypothetical protein GCM10014713_03670 [Streptomyces purpureus]|uniref:Uncharacterized protein n=1 Tax=Streptomyces purpureus TaxID=1951 RepID=A0A918LL30_9ACTN|nr:hypothetical protein GCM10014713_03670 [Streptomyces purpureus]
MQALTRTLAERAAAGRGGSSAMPHKRDPVLATLIRSVALQIPALATGLTQCVLCEYERSARRMAHRTAAAARPLHLRRAGRPARPGRPHRRRRGPGRPRVPHRGPPP